MTKTRRRFTTSAAIRAREAAKKIKPRVIKVTPAMLESAKRTGGVTVIEGAPKAIDALARTLQAASRPPPAPQPPRPPPRWDQEPPGASRSAGSTSAATPRFQPSSGSPEPLPTSRLQRSYRASDAVSVFRASLTGPQLAAGIADDFNPFAVAEHYRLYGARGRRASWR